jgi:hypothetical protein
LSIASIRQHAQIGDEEGLHEAQNRQSGNKQGRKCRRSGITDPRLCANLAGSALRMVDSEALAAPARRKNRFSVLFEAAPATAR